MRYELLLQPREPTAIFELAPLEAALEARKATKRPDGVWVWKLAAGEVELRPVLENGRPVALELAVPFSDRDALVREVVGEAIALAEAGGVRVVDPTLGRALRLEDEAAVLESWLGAAKYAGEYLGVSSALGATYVPRDDEEGLKPGTKVMLALLVFGVFLFIGWKLLVR